MIIRIVGIMVYVYLWLAVVVASIIVEFCTADLVSVWFIVGGAVAMILAFLEVDIVWQIVAFVAVSALFLIVLRKPLLKLLDKNKVKTNADALVGQEFTLLTPIQFGALGSVKVAGVEWSATCEDAHAQIDAGKIVRVVKISGNKLIVEEK